MRWGVRDEASIDHSGPKICMDELKSCQKLSLGPNFVVRALIHVLLLVVYLYAQHSGLCMFVL
jgi:hypothetical protein